MSEEMDIKDCCHDKYSTNDRWTLVSFCNGCGKGIATLPDKNKKEMQLAFEHLVKNLGFLHYKNSNNGAAVSDGVEAAQKEELQKHLEIFNEKITKKYYAGGFRYE